MGTHKVYVIECDSWRYGLTKPNRVIYWVGVTDDIEESIDDHKCHKVKATSGRSIKWLANSKWLPHSEANKLRDQLIEIQGVRERGNVELLWWCRQQGGRCLPQLRSALFCPSVSTERLQRWLTPLP